MRGGDRLVVATATCTPAATEFFMLWNCDGLVGSYNWQPRPPVASVYAFFAKPEAKG